MTKTELILRRIWGSNPPEMKRVQMIEFQMFIDEEGIKVDEDEVVCHEFARLTGMEWDGDTEEPMFESKERCVTFYNPRSVADMLKILKEMR